MKLEMRQYARPEDTEIPRCDMFISGCAVDERGGAALKIIAPSSTTRSTITYVPETFEIRIDDETYPVEGDGLVEWFASLDGKTVGIEATTLGFVETLTCIRHLTQLSETETSILYVEPNEYLPHHRSGRVLEKRDFQLSEEFPGFKPIPGSVIMLRDGGDFHGVFFLGYEARRFRQALESFPMIDTKLCSVVFGIPDYSAGWTMNAFANNIKTLKDYGISSGICFCAANNPLSAYRRLEAVYRSLPEPKRMFIAPFGTKPHGIGTALFVAKHPSVGILYDHPSRSKGRSQGVGHCHLYRVNCE